MKEYERECWSCLHRFTYQLNEPPNTTDLICPSCRKFQGSITWGEMDEGVWWPFPMLKDAPIPYDERVYYTKARIPSRLRWDIYERDNYVCLHCGKNHDLSIDHIIPEVKGGTLDKDNLQTLCKSCNSKKGTRV